MATEDRIKSALKKGRKLHTDEVSYKRADNGGIHARVERHTKDGPHHTEHHVLAGKDDAAKHLLEHMADQPDIGQGAPPQDAPAPPQEAGAGGAPGGAPDAMGGAAGAGAGPMMQ